MIVVELAGGVGNQLFQYAAARVVADRIGTDLGIDVRVCRAPDSRPYALDAFRIRGAVVPDRDLMGVHGHRSLPWQLTGGVVTRARAMLQRPRLGHLTRVIHQEPGYTGRLDSVVDDSWLCGYWQSERYFAHAADAIRADLTLRGVSPVTAALERRIRAMPFPVAVHVRRGDYADVESTRRYHGLQPPEYYQAAIEQIRSAHPRAQFVFFSDDPLWVAANLAPDISILVTENGRERPSEDLHLMTCCRAHIIANSSFSWWGAWLGASDIVIAPARWFQAPEMAGRTIVLDRWRRL